MPLISVFTPSYNRAGKLHRVFNSLLKQSFKDFEWIIVDDGSTDNTKDIIENFRSTQPPFNISYFYQTNAGKHIAINQGVSMASGEWFHIADSDDELEPETLMIFMDTWQAIPGELKNEYCGILACCKDQYGNRISDKVPGGVFDGRLRELFYKYKFRKESFHIYKTAILKDFPFPGRFRNIYFPEGLIWRKMSDKYMIRLIDKELRIYYIENEGNSLMSAKKNYSGKALAACIESADILNNDLGYFIYYPSYFCKAALIYYAYKPFLDRTMSATIALNRNAAIFAFPFMIAGWLTHLVFRKKNTISKKKTALK